VAGPCAWSLLQAGGSTESELCTINSDECVVAVADKPAEELPLDKSGTGEASSVGRMGRLRRSSQKNRPVLLDIWAFRIDFEKHLIMG
jgi:hypothetical protein